MMKKSGFVFIASLLAFNANAAEDSKALIDTNKIYFGGGLGFNSLSGVDFGDALGFQFFAGYQLPVNMDTGELSVELGYMDSGDFDESVSTSGFRTFSGEASANGLWVNGVIDYPLQDKLSVVGRVGLDLGDDDGVMLGAGLGFQLNEKMDVRAEYVIRDHIDSLQVNLVIRQ